MLHRFLLRLRLLAGLALVGLAYSDAVLLNRYIEPLSHWVEARTGYDCFDQRRAVNFLIATRFLFEVPITHSRLLSLLFYSLTLIVFGLWLSLVLFPDPHAQTIRRQSAQGFVNYRKISQDHFWARTTVLILTLLLLPMAILTHYWDSTEIMSLCALGAYLSSCNPLPPSEATRPLHRRLRDWARALTQTPLPTPIPIPTPSE